MTDTSVIADYEAIEDAEERAESRSIRARSWYYPRRTSSRRAFVRADVESNSESVQTCVVTLVFGIVPSQRTGDGVIDALTTRDQRFNLVSSGTARIEPGQTEQVFVPFSIPDGIESGTAFSCLAILRLTNAATLDSAVMSTANFTTDVV